MDPKKDRRTAWLALLLGFAIVGSASADLVTVVCPLAQQAALRPWVRLREAQGHRITVTDRIAPTASEGRSSSADARPRRVLLIIGDGTTAGLAPQRVQARIIRRYAPEADIATDLAWCDALGFDVVARLPFNEAESLAAYARRVVAREQRPIGCGEARLRLTAGVGGFSPMIDAAIEGAGRRIVSGLAPLTSDVSFEHLIHKDELSNRHLDAPGGIWVWLGHGLRNQLPGVPSHRLVEAAGGADVAVLLACYAGDFSAKGLCVAEQLLSDTNGPLAVVASTRVSMPYGNARLGGELLAAMQRSPGETLGGLWAKALRRNEGDAEEEVLALLDPLAGLLGGDIGSLSEERREHRQMYCLLGDPLLKIDRRETLPIQAPPCVLAGGQLAVRGTAPSAGNLWIEVVRPAGSGDRRASDALNHEAGRIEAGGFSRSLQLPKGWLSGERIIRVRLKTERGMAAGAAAFRIEPTKQTTRSAG